MELIRNCAHFSSTCVAVSCGKYGKPAKVIKTAFNKEGAQNIKNEHKGIIWYCRQRNIDPGTFISSFQYGNSFARLEFAYKNGGNGNLDLAIEKNFTKLRNAIDHYVEIFGKPGFNFQHGDYSIGNIVFDNEQILWVLDWENFSDMLTPEIDLLCCIMEPCFFRYQKKKGLSKSDVKTMMELFKYVSNHIELSDEFIRRPALYIRDIRLKNKQIFGTQIMKYPFVNCSLKDILQIDSYLGNRYHSKF